MTTVRRLIVSALLGLCLAGCGLIRGPQVPVPITTVEGQVCCWLSFSVVDVVADPISGAPVDKANGKPFTWMAGFTAWRIGAEVEVRDASGNVVLTTPGRFRIIPSYPDWAVGEVKPCTGCVLGGGPL